MVPRVGWALAPVLCIAITFCGMFTCLVSADIVNHGELEIRNASLVTLWATEMYAQGSVDSMSPGDGRSFVELTVSLSRPPSVDLSFRTFLEVIIINSNNLDHVGNGPGTSKCCTTDEVGTPGCTDMDVGRLIIPPNRIKEQDFDLRRDMVVLDPNSRVVTKSIVHTRLQTGRYMMYVASCHAPYPLTIRINATWMNPFGHLPGHLYGYLKLFFGLMIAYGCLFVLWISLCLYYRKDVIKLQIGILVVLAFCLSEAILCFVDHLHHNNTGSPSKLLVIMCIIDRAFHQCLSRLLIIVVAMGYGLVRPSLKTFSRRLTLFGLSYALVALLRDLTYRLDTTGTTTSAPHAVGLTLLLVALESYFFLWVFYALHETVGQLKSRQQHAKLRLYTHVTIAMVIAFVAALGCSIYNVATDTFEYQASHWALLWLADVGFWQLIYLWVIVAIAFIFRPSSNAKKYEYAQVGDLPMHSAPHGSEDDHLDAMAGEVSSSNGGNRDGNYGRNNRSRSLETDNDGRRTSRVNEGEAYDSELELGVVGSGNVGSGYGDVDANEEILDTDNDYDDVEYGMPERDGEGEDGGGILAQHSSQQGRTQNVIHQVPIARSEERNVHHSNDTTFNPSTSSSIHKGRDAHPALNVDDKD